MNELFGGTDAQSVYQGNYLQDLYGQAQMQSQGNMGTDYSQQFMQPTFNAYSQLMQGQNPQYLQGIASGQTQNQNLGGAIQAGLGQINRNFNRNIMPGINQGAAMSGTSGGSRQGIAQGLAMSDANQQATDFVNQMQSQNYQSGIQNQIGAADQMNQNAQTQMGAMGMSPQLSNLGFSSQYGNLQNYGNLLGSPTTLGGETQGSMLSPLSIF